MAQLKINEQIAFLRKQKGMTQEELAQALGVSNQAVSKWESAQCCPDLQLLPEIARLFSVSIDELMGYKETDTFENIYLKIKALFEAAPAESAFHNAFRLSVLLHEAACSRGYKGYIPWDTAKNFGLEDIPHKWGSSACSEPEGCTLYSGNGIFIADTVSYAPPTPAQIHDLYLAIERLADKAALKTLYALYELTMHDFDIYVPASDIAAKAKLTQEETEKAIERIPVIIKEDNGQTLYRIDGPFMHVPPLLLMLCDK